MSMRKLALCAVLLACAAAASADGFMGFSESDIQGAVIQAQAQQKAEQLRALGYAPGALTGVSKALGYTARLTSAQDCVYDAVAAHLGADPFASGAVYPDVLFASDVNADLFRSAYAAQFPKAPAPAAVVNAFLPSYNVIYVDDAASSYKNGATMDDALAGEYARFIDNSVRGLTDSARQDADAAAVSAWYRAQYPAGRSSCR
jgi:hypothetical protein